MREHLLEMSVRPHEIHSLMKIQLSLDGRFFHPLSRSEEKPIINSLCDYTQIKASPPNCLSFIPSQQILKEERLTFKFLDVVTILLNYCGPKLSESEDKEMKAVIRDLVIIIGYFCANNRRNQVIFVVRNYFSPDIVLKSINESNLLLTSIKFIAEGM